jgi:arylsulfatase A-like enzyme
MGSTQRKTVIRFGALAVVGAAVMALSSATVPARAPDDPLSAPTRPSVIVICVDTLRADHLASYGRHRPITPRIDALLARGVVMEKARTPIPLTTPAVASVLTSLYPHRHGSTRNGVPVYPGLTTLPGLLAGQGYQTAAVVSNWTLRDHLSHLGAAFQSYFEAYDRKRWRGLFKSEGSAQLVNSTVFRWVDGPRDPRRPFFLWVHYIEPHAPYRFHGEYAGQVGIPDGAPADAAGRYATEVAYVDARLGELLDGLEARDLLGGNLVVLLADHGESLGEHSAWGHGQVCYEECLRVPLGFVYPGAIPSGRRVRAQVTLLDIAPTILGLLGLDPPSSMEGRNLSDVCAGRRELEEVPCYFQAQRGAVLRRKHVDQGRVSGPLEISRIFGESKTTVRYHSAGQVYRYNLGADPGEWRNLARPGEELSADLAAWEKDVFGVLARQQREDPVLAEDDVERLKALGYLVE